MTTVVLDSGQLLNIVQTIFFLVGVLAGGLSGFALIKGVE